MNHFDYKNGEMLCEGVRLADIAAQVGTPAYVYSTATLERHYDVFAAAFAPQTPLIAFAMKANSNLAVLKVLAKKGAGADTVSDGEIKRALAAGFAPEKIIFSGVGKTESELTFACEKRVGQINVESPAEFAMLEAVAAKTGTKPGVAIRINPGIGAGGHAKISTGGNETKFGVSADEAVALYRRAAAAPHLNARALAVHIGSQIKDLAPLEDTFRLLRSLVETLRGEGIAIDHLDLGGGLGVPYFHEAEPPTPDVYAAMIKRVFAGLDVSLAFEPGRLICGNAGILLSRVIRHQNRVDRTILVVDGAMNDLIRPAMYESFHDIRPVKQPQGAPTPCDVVGPICETGDIFARDRMLPPIGDGELVAFMTAGAYGAVMASTYNSRALVPEILVSGERFAVIRDRWPIEAQLALEHVPEWL